MAVLRKGGGARVYTGVAVLQYNAGARLKTGVAVKGLTCQHLLILKYLFQEFYLRRLHNLLTDFIIQMPLKLKELRNKAEDAAKTYNQHMQVSNPTLSFHRLTRGHQPNMLRVVAPTKYY